MFHVENEYLVYDDAERGLVTQVDDVTKYHRTRRNSKNVVILHNTGGLGNMAQAVHSTKGTGREVKRSWHITISRDGDVNQLLDFSRVAMHAGKSRLVTPGRTYNSLNSYALALTLENYGPVDSSFDGEHYRYHRRLDSGETVEVAETTRIGDTYWHSYAPVQIDLAVNICRALVSAYGVSAVAGSHEISRSLEPVGLLDMDAIRSQVFSGTS